jgi:hypothetical protein
VPISLGSIPHRHRPTPPNRSAKQVRQTGPPTDTAKLLRQAESANQRAPTAGDRLTRSVTWQSSHRSVPISHGSIPHRRRRHRQRGLPEQVRQLTPPSSSASQRAPTRERRLPETVSPDRQPADPRIEACLLVAGQSRTATGDTANEVRQTDPPTDTAKLLRQSESANQSAPTAGDHLPRSETCRSSHRSVPISRGSIPHRHRPTSPTRSANEVRQLTPPSLGPPNSGCPPSATEAVRPKPAGHPIKAS